MAYGMANRRGDVGNEQAVSLIRQAIGQGIDWIDTARAYGEAERRIGLALQDQTDDHLTIASKLSPGAEDAASARTSIETSLEKLQCNSFDVLMLHRFEHRLNPAIWSVLSDYRDKHIIRRLGASVQSREEANVAMADPAIEVIQLPCNLLDWRWHDMKKPRDTLHIQVRSALLQGVFMLPADQWPNVIATDAAQRYLDRIHTLASRYANGSVPALAYGYLRALEWVDSIVIGMETPEQLAENSALFSEPPLSDEAVDAVQKAFADTPEALLNPALW